MNSPSSIRLRYAQHVMRHMPAAGGNLKITYAIISLIFVFVMHDFIHAQNTAKVLLHKPSVVTGFFSTRKANAVVSVLRIKPRIRPPSSTFSCDFTSVASSPFAVWRTALIACCIHPHIIPGQDKNARAT
jgi:hypothetical protein